MGDAMQLRLALMAIVMQRRDASPALAAAVADAGRNY